MADTFKQLAKIFAFTLGGIVLLFLVFYKKSKPPFHPPHMLASGWVIEKQSHRVRPDSKVEIWRRLRFRTGPEPTDTASSMTLVKTIAPDSGYYRFEYWPGEYEAVVAKVSTTDGKHGQLMLLPAADSAESPFVANLPVE
jgi:hypothetical protein